MFGRAPQGWKCPQAALVPETDDDVVKEELCRVRRSSWIWTSALQRMKGRSMMLSVNDALKLLFRGEHFDISAISSGLRGRDDVRVAG